MCNKGMSKKRIAVESLKYRIKLPQRAIIITKFSEYSITSVSKIDPN